MLFHFRLGFNVKITIKTFVISTETFGSIDVNVGPKNLLMMILTYLMPVLKVGDLLNSFFTFIRETLKIYRRDDEEP